MPQLCNHFCPEHPSSPEVIGKRLMDRYGVQAGAVMGRSTEAGYDFIITAGDADYLVQVSRIVEQP